MTTEASGAESNLESTWSTYAPAARPLFRWAGGKQRFLWDHREKLPYDFNRYHEPFAGGMSVYFHIAARSSTPVEALLADVNLRVMRTYEEVKWEPAQVADRLRQLEAAYNAATDPAAFYNDVRAQHNRIFPSHDAARFIFLMNTCWNGVFRINQAGQFNVPHGAPKNALSLPTRDEIFAVSTVLQHAKMRAQSWESSLTSVLPGDFVFLDPPYFHEEDRRDLYEKNRLFTIEDHVRLADALADLKDRGVDFLLTNSAFPAMQALYRDRGLDVEVIDVHRSISSKREGRGKVGELVVTPGPARANSMLRSAQLKLMVGDA